LTASDLLHLRLSTQGVSRRAFQTAEDVVRWLGAAQSQDYPAAAWAVGQRARNATHAMLDRAFDEGRILRTHVMRPTWHFVMPADIRWMLQLTGPRVNAMSAPYYRKMELDERVFSRTRSTIARALRGGRQLTRADLAAELQKAGITKPNTPLRVSFIMLRAELDGLVCSGARIGRHFTYALLDERVPEAPTLDRDAALAELTRRYFTSHGPATVHDYSWWSGQTMGDARAGLEMVKSELVETAIDGASFWSAPAARARGTTARRAYLLPAYDECMLSYRDVRVALKPYSAQLTLSAGATIVIDGRVVGAWKRNATTDGISLQAVPFTSFTRRDRDAIEEAAEGYGRFWATPVSVQCARMM